MMFNDVTLEDMLRFDEEILACDPPNQWTECLADAPNSREFFEVDEEMKELMGLTACLALPRYLVDRSSYEAAVFASMNDDAAQLWISPRKLKKWCHCSEHGFASLLELIQKDPVFVSAGRSQCCVRFQLFCALARFGNYGGSVEKFTDVCHVSHGSVLTYADRCCTAILNLERMFVRWPNSARRRKLAAFGHTEFNFPGYIGHQDGTHVYLFNAPNHCMYPEAFFDTLHKGGYGYNILLTADHTGSIIHYSLGWPGQTHDATIQLHLDMYHQPWKYFDRGQFLFVDSGFSRQMWAVPPYKGKKALIEKNAAFNKAMRRGRCRIEHVNARLKNRFASLKSIPIKVQSPSDHDRVNRWIRACIILHNFFLRIDDKWDFTSGTKCRKRRDAELEVDDGDDVAGAEFQDMVRDRWLQMSS
jgi:hypothetical protein